MAGILNVLAAGGALGSYRITLGNDGSVTGYSSLGTGSVAPSGTFLTTTLIRAYGQNSADVFVVRVNDTVAQTFFTSVDIQESDGTWTTLRSTDASFSGGNNWAWTISGAAGSTIWSTGDAGNVRRLVFR
jgi:hypothetical protein